jgi:hypothetical protein
MRCYNCGREIHGAAVEDTTSEPTTSAGPWGQHTKTVEIKLCPECAERERGMPKFMLAVFLVAVAVLSILAFVFQW